MTDTSANPGPITNDTATPPASESPASAGLGVSPPVDATTVKTPVGNAPKQSSILGEAATPAETAYELKLPENSHIDPTSLDEIVSFAKEQGLSAEAAQKILERENGAIQKYSQAQSEQFQRETEEWPAQLMADPEFGGGNDAQYKQRVLQVQSLLQKHAPKEFLKQLDDTGFGNHPGLIKFFYSLAKSASNDTIVLPGTQVPMQEKSLADRFYPKQEG